MPRRAVKWALVLGGGMAALLLLALVLLPSLLNMERYRGLMAGRISRALGREVSLGAVRLSLLPSVALEVRGIRIAGTARTAPPLLEADALSVHIRPLALLLGQVKVTRASLDRPRLTLARERDGRWSLEDLLHPAPAAAPPPGRVPGEGGRPARPTLLAALSVGRVSISDGEVTLTDAAVPGPPRVTKFGGVSLELAQPEATGPVAFRGSGSVGADPPARVEVRGRLTPAAEGFTGEAAVNLRGIDLAALRPYLGVPRAVDLGGRADLQVTAQGSSRLVRFEGEVGLGQVRAEVPGVLRKGSGEEGRITFRGQVAGEGLELDPIALTLKRTTVEGKVTVAPLRPPRLAFSLSSPRVDLDQLLATDSRRARLGGMAWAAPAPPVGAAPAAPPPWTAGGSVAVADLRWHRLQFSDLTAQVQYREGLLSVTDLQLAVYGGRLAGKGMLELSGKTPVATMTSRVEGVSLEPLVKPLGLDGVSLKGRVDMETDLRLPDPLGDDRLGGATGKGRVSITRGVITGYRPLDRLSDALDPLLRSQGLGRLEEFDSLSGHFALDKGSVQTRDLVLTKREAKILAAGSLGLLDQTLDFDVSARFAGASLDVKVTGTAAKPLIALRGGRLPRGIQTEIDRALREKGGGLKDMLRNLFR